MKSHVLEAESPLVASVREEGKTLPASPDERVRRLRRESLDRFLERGLPGPSEEGWRFTSVKALGKLAVSSVSSSVVSTREAETVAARSSVPDGAAVRLVFVNGELHEGLSSRPPGTVELEAESLAAALADESKPAAALFGSAVAPERHRFGALNTAFFRDGAWLRILPGRRPAGFLHLLFLTIPTDGKPPVAYPRIAVRVEAGAEATVLEEHLSVGSSALMSDGVTEIWVEENGSLDHYTLQRESEAAFHLGTLAARVGRDATFSTHSLSLGGKWTRNDVDVVLEGEGGSCDLAGLYLTQGRQHMDHHTFMDHASPHTSSREFYRGVLDGHSTAVFHGHVLIRPGAQRTDTVQTNNNLLLSPHAKVNTDPQLEIFADDVKARHGATVSQLEDEYVFYLRSRGIPAEEARRLLIQGFVGEILDRVKVEALRRSLRRVVEERF